MIKLSSEKQKKKHYIINVSGEVHLFTVDKNDAIKQVENAIEGLEWNTGLEFYLDIDEEVDKITLQLDPDRKAEIDIISKAFKISPGELIKKMITRDLDWIKQGISDKSLNGIELMDYYCLKEFIPEELGKLFLLEEVL